MHPILALCVMLLFMSLVWGWYLVTNNPSVVDVAWSLGLMLLGVLQLASAGFFWRNLLFGAVLLLWGVRLAGFLWWTRIRLKQHDKRYTELDTSWCQSKDLAFLINYQAQGLLIVLIALPWYFIAHGHGFTWLDGLGLCAALGFITLETLADWQLRQFKRQHPGQVCNTGLWYYSRHPNYFFEWLTWCAFTLCALSTSWGWLAILSPLTLYLVMTKLTGPMTELGSLKARGEAYRAYQRITPLFFPKFK